MIRVVNGKGVEHWVVRDDATLMRQITGQLPAPDQQRSDPAHRNATEPARRRGPLRVPLPSPRAPLP